MFTFCLKKIFFLLLACAFCFSLEAQQTHFIYLQTDNGQPFYVKMNNKVISSSAEGYVILPDMLEGTYQIAVGFPKKEHPEETFTLSLDGNNEGYVIKDFEDTGLQLFNLETLALINGSRDSGRIVTAAVTKDADPFSKMLANVVKDSSILQDHQVKVSKPVTSAVASAADTNNIAVAPASTTDTFATAKTAPISKLESTRDSTGLLMIYTAENNEKTDTVTVFIPSTQEQVESKENNLVAENKNAGISSSADTAKFTITPTVVNQNRDSGFVFRKDSIATNKDSGHNPVQVFVIGPAKDESSIDKEKKNHERPVQEIQDDQQKKNEKARDDEVILLPKVVTSSKVNSDCKSFAGNGDFLRLRKKMAAENSSEEMIKVAKKYFKNKCFSTEQIKDLSYLFLNDEGRYNFFDAAYPHTSDSDQYEQLESQLTDQYYINRFKAMIRK
jgi:hypothetical protein